MLTDDDALVEQVFARLCAKYVQRQDDRQKAMGLQYTTAETHDLAEFIASIRTTDAARIAALEDLLCLADELLMDAWGAYPLPFNPNRERMGMIRAVTGDHYHTRKDRAARATFRSNPNDR